MSSDDLTSTIAQSLALSYGSHVTARTAERDWRAAEDLLPLIAAELVAAEQRGAVRALKDYRQFMVRVIKPGLVNREGLIADIDESLKRLDETDHMLMGPLSRADQTEGGRGEA